MARLDPEIEAAAMEALDKLVLQFGLLSPSRRPSLAIELGGAVIDRSPTHDFTCLTADGSLQHCEIRPDALEALRHLSPVLRDRMSVLIECERWQHSLARNWLAHRRFRQLSGITAIEFCQPGWFQGWDVGSGYSQLVVGASQPVPAPASSVSIYRVDEPNPHGGDGSGTFMTWDEVVAAVIEAEELSNAAEDAVNQEVARLENLIGRERVSELRRQRLNETMARAAEEGFYVVESDLNRFDTGVEPFYFHTDDPETDE